MYLNIYCFVTKTEHKPSNSLSLYVIDTNSYYFWCNEENSTCLPKIVLLITCLTWTLVSSYNILDSFPV